MSRAFVFGVSLVLMACSQNPQPLSTAQKIQSAQQLLQQRNHAQAIPKLRQILQDHPTQYPQLYLQLAEAYLASGEASLAEHVVRNAQAENIWNSDLQLLLTKALLFQARYQELLRDIYPSPNYDYRTNAHIAWLRGDALFAQKYFSEAQLSYLEAIAKDPQTLPAYWGLYRYYVVQNDLDKAQKQLEKALKINPRSAKTYAILGNLAHRQKQYTKALNHYQRALQYVPNNAEAVFGATSILIYQDQTEAAQKLLDSLSSSNTRNHPLSYHLRALIAFRHADLEAAAQLFSEALQRNANYLPSLLWTGLLSFVQGQFESSYNDLSKYVYVVSNDTIARQFLAAISLETSTNSDRISTLLTPSTLSDEEILSQPLIGEQFALLGNAMLGSPFFMRCVEEILQANQIKWSLSTALTQLVQTQHIPASLNQIIQIFSAPSVTRGHIQALLNQQQYAQVIQKSRAKIPAKPDITHIVWLELIAKAHQQNQQFSKAKQVYQQILHISPQNIAAQLELITLQINLQQYAPARMALQALLRRHPDSEAAYALQYRLEKEQFGLETAQTWLKSLTKHHIRNSPALIAPLAQTLIEEGRPTQALVITSALALQKPSHPEIIALRGDAYLASLDPVNAATAYKQTLPKRHAPNAEAHYLKLIQAYLQSNDISLARDSFHLLPAQFKTKWSAQWLDIQLDFEEGHLKQGKRKLEQLIQRHPHHEMLQVQKSWTLQSSKAAQRYLQKLQPKLNTHAAQQHAKRLIVHHLIQQDQAPQALSWIVQQNPLQSGNIALAKIGIELAIGLKAYPTAQSLLKALHQQYPKDIAILARMAYLQHLEKATQQAQTTLLKASKLAPHSPYLLLIKGRMALDKARPFAALSYLEKATHSAPALQEAAYFYALTLHQTGQNNKAGQVLKTLAKTQPLQPSTYYAQLAQQQLTKLLTTQP